MNRYLLIDRFNYTIYDCNTLDIENNFDEFGASVTCLDNYDLLKTLNNSIIDEVINNKDLLNFDKYDILYELYSRLELELEILRKKQRNGDL